MKALEAPSAPTGEFQKEQRARRREYQRLLDEGKVEEAVSVLDEHRQRDLLNDHGAKADEQTLSVESMQNNLARADRQAGTRSAILYVNLREPREGEETGDIDLVLVVAKPDEEPTPESDADDKKFVCVAKVNANKDINTATVLKAARDLREALTHNLKRQRPFTYLGLAKLLYQATIAPIEDALEAHSVNNLLVSLDNQMQNVPIAAFHDGEQYLVEKFAIAIAPTLQGVDTEYESLAEENVLALGASEFQGMSALHSVPQELDGVTRNGELGKIHLNNDFTLDNLQSPETQDFDIVHMATHGVFDKDSSRSHILLGGGPEIGSDPKLYGKDVPNLDLGRTRALLFLSACQTDTGDINLEQGLAGSFWANAKADTVIGSLWLISDVATAGLVNAFYHHVREEGGMPVSLALQTVQKSMIAGEVKIVDRKERLLQYAEGVKAVKLPPEAFEQPGIPDEFSNPYYWSGLQILGSAW